MTVLLGGSPLQTCGRIKRENILNSKTTAMLLFALIFVLCVAAYGSEKISGDLVIPQPPSYPIDSTVATTLDWTILPVPVPSSSPGLFPYELSKYAQFGYGLWEFGAGIDREKRLDLMPSTYTGASVTKAANLLRFFTMSDIHLTDKESPAQAIYFGYKGGSSWQYSGAMLYTTQIFDAAIQTVDALNNDTPFDFGMFLGDAINNNQYNELRWYIDVLDGKIVNPDSGAKDDPIPGPLNDYQDVYKAAGLEKSIPWYQALGNHDHFWLGSRHANEYLLQTYTGEYILNLGSKNNSPNGLDSRGFYMGSIDGRTPYGDVIGAGPESDFSSPPKILAADQNRHALSREEWMNEFFNTTSSPVGHGFNQADADRGFACYSFEPKANLPLKVIVLDDTQPDDDNNTDHSAGYVDQERYDWLVDELDKGQAEGKLMIIAAHVPIGVTVGHYPSIWHPTSAVTEKNILTKLHTYPNLILWISGHTHRNVVTAQKSPDASHPELGFWVVETASMHDFPQQFRTFDIVRNSDNTISIFATDVDPAVRAGSPAAISRSYTIASKQLFNYATNPAPTGAYNVELVKQLSSEMSDAIAPIIQITIPTTAATIARNCSTLNLSGTASDNKGVVSVSWLNNKNGNTGDCDIDGTIWSVEKVNLAIGDNPLIFTAADAAGNTATTTITVTYINTVPGTSWKGLTMLSLPIIPDQTDPKFATRFYGNGWCSFITDLNKYSVYPDSRCWLLPAEKTPGRGFWARFQSTTIPYGSIPNQNQSTRIHLQPGWNLIGNPFITAVKWDIELITVQRSGTQAITLKNAKDMVCSYAWGWKQNVLDPNSGSYDLVYDETLMPDATSSLMPWQGYWIKAMEECELILPTPSTLGIQNARSK